MSATIPTQDDDAVDFRDGGSRETGDTLVPPDRPRRPRSRNTVHYGDVVDIDDRVPLDYDIHSELRETLFFFFLNPIDKWRYRKRFPFKLVVQVLKIFLVTTQLVLFAGYRYSHVYYTRNIETTMRHLFIKTWDDTREVTAYPPGTGPLAVYTQESFFEQINFAVDTYATIRNMGLTAFAYENADGTMNNMTFCKEFYKEGIIWAFNESYVFDGTVLRECLNISSEAMKQHDSDPGFDSKQYFYDNNFTIRFDAFVSGELHFNLKTINFRKIMPLDIPDCYLLRVQILLDNEDHDGQIRLSLTSEAEKLLCRGDTESIAHDSSAQMLRTVLNTIVIVCCCASFVLCARALFRAHVLKERTVRHFQRYLKQNLSFNEQMEFVNLWYLMICVNDVLIISGSVVKELVESKSIGDWWNVTGVLLGTGNLMVWVGVLRYLGFFQKYNILIVTLKRSMPNIMRFLFCVLLIYAGFALCGWVVLGPYHLKFETLATTSECLFSLVNGDDMFATFRSLATDSPLLWWYTRIYLYSFITLFIYAILSLFTAIILDTYETIKNDFALRNDLATHIRRPGRRISLHYGHASLYQERRSSMRDPSSEYYEKGFPQNELEKFIFIQKDMHIGMQYVNEPSCFQPVMTSFDRLMAWLAGWGCRKGGGSGGGTQGRPEGEAPMEPVTSPRTLTERTPLLPKN